MSVTLKVDKTSATSGYFRIGNVFLQIPPDAIQLDKATNNDEVAPLRARYAYTIKTGQARWNLTIHWRALLGDNADGTTDWSQWEDVRTILAMVKAAPFVDIENADVRNLLVQQDPTMSSTRMAFALKQLTLQTSTDIVDGIDCTLNMTLFNFLPFSKDFAYQGQPGDPSGDAPDSSAFTHYLNDWKLNNLDHPYRQADKDSAENIEPPAWATQQSGDLQLLYRKYYTQQGAPLSVDQTALTDEGDLLADLPFDHFTSAGVFDGVTFRYTTRAIDMSGGEYESNKNELYVNQTSVSFTNNFAVLPLAGYQYPTLQHIGPASTMISISLQQKGYESPGLPLISEMLSTLETQYLAMRNQWRRTSSIHRMQAIFVQNQFLNMLGIFGLIDNQFSIQSVDESADLIQAQLVTRQYENIYETLDPYMVKGPLADSGVALDAVFASSQYANILKDASASNAVKSVIEFQAARSKLDIGYLVKYLELTQDILPGLSSMVPIPGKLTDVEVTLLKTVASSLGNGNTNDSGSQNGSPYFSGLSNSGKFGASDLFYMANNKQARGIFGIQTGLEKGPSPSHIKDTIALWNRIVSQDTSTPTLIAKIYNAVLSQRSTGQDPAFNAALNLLLENPKIKSLFLAKIAENKLPSSNHGAYADLGIAPSNAELGAFNPAIYFADQSAANITKFRADVTALLNGRAAVPAHGSVAAIPAVPGLLDGYLTMHPDLSSAPGMTTPQPTANVTPDPTLQITQSNPAGILQRTNMPDQTMKNAFPTFKLFLMEEDNLYIYHMVDDFYSYSSVLDIEVENHRERGSTAIVHITNLTGIMSHILFDGSILGKYQSDKAVWTPVTSMSGANAGDRQMAGDPALMNSKDNVTSSFGLGNMQEGTRLDGHVDMIPLRYFALQTGSKIQIRMGFDNDPDKLTPVFQGVVTNISGTEVIEIIAQGFQTELMKPDESLNTNGWSPAAMVGNLFNNADQAITDIANGFVKNGLEDLATVLNLAETGPAYGGWRLWGEAGDTGSVMEAVLKGGSAKHFGRWQVAQATDSLLKGHSWAYTVGSWLDNDGILGPALKTAYDRRGENICIDKQITLSGKVLDSKTPTRSVDFETPTAFRLGAVPSYYVDSNLDVSSWQVIRDISRRYPEYNLSVKNYGFPTQADATLVFGHPLDMYYTRMPWLGEDLSTQRVNGSDASGFAAFWGRNKGIFVDIWVGNKSTVGNISPEKLGLSGISLSTGQTMLTYPEASALKQTQYDAYLNGKTIADQVTAANIESILDNTLHQVEFNKIDVALYAAGNTGPINHATASILSFKNRMEREIAFDRDPSGSLTINPTARIKPIRMFHYADHRTIIHNGITVNNEFNNAVTFNEEVFPLNGMIPSQYLRIVNVDDQILHGVKNSSKINNVNPGSDIEICYAQSFLRDEAAKMYRGEIVLSLMPQIEYGDILMILDPSTGLTGPVEVESVIHSFDQTNGAVTIVRPRAWFTVNEAASANIMACLWQTLHQVGALGQDFSTAMAKTSPTSQAAAKYTGVAAAGSAVATVATLASLAKAIATTKAAITNAMSSPAAVDSLTIQLESQEAAQAAVSAVTVSEGAVVEGTALASGEVVAEAAGLFGGPPGLVIAALVTGALFLIGGVVVAKANRKNKLMNLMLIVPLSRNGHPWVGGLQGYQIGNISTFYAQTWEKWVIDELEPTIHGYRALMNGFDPFRTKDPSMSSGSKGEPEYRGPINVAQDLAAFIKGRSAAIQGWLVSASQQYGIPLTILQAVLMTESGGGHKVSPKGAAGIMQFMPATAASLGVDVSNDQSSIVGAGKLFYQLFKRFKAWDFALAGYNWRPDALQNAIDKTPTGGQTRLPDETFKYVSKILKAAGFPASGRIVSVLGVKL